METGLTKLSCSKFELKDQRLNNRMHKICIQLKTSAGLSTPETINDRGQTKAYYRFINNHHVEPKYLIEGYAKHSVNQTESSNVVLSIQDTTTLQYSSKRSAPNLESFLFSLQ